MATVSLTSSVITNRDATPPVASNGQLSGGMLVEGCGDFSIATSDNIGSKYRCVRVPSNARVSQILLSCTDSGTVGAIDIGVYKQTKDGGTVVDADFFASAQVLTTALTNSDVTNESTTYDYTKQNQPLWQAVGLSADPKSDLDIVATMTAVADTATTGNIKVRYCV